MSRRNTVLQILVASPSDVAEERALLESIVGELNRIWSSSLGISFELLVWEKRVRPGFDDDPQAVINTQIPNDYDVFIGIFWSRLGTPTGRAASGTVEEFERALGRFEASGRVPEIMIYFKDAPLSPSKIDGAQLMALQDFRSSVSARGGLYSTFEDLAGFEASVRAHLSAIAQNFVSESANNDEPTSKVHRDDNEPSVTDDTDYGLFDYLDIYVSRTNDMTAAMQLISDATARVAEKLGQRNAERASSGNDAQSIRRSVKRAADDMINYAETLNGQVTILSSARQDAFSALSKAVALMPDFPGNVEQLRGLHQSLSGTVTSASTARSGLMKMLDATLALPRISKDLNMAKRAVVQNLGKLLTEIDSTESTVNNLLETMSKLLDSIQ